MNDRYVGNVRAHARGRTNSTLLAIVVGIGLLALGVWFLIRRDMPPEDTAGRLPAPAASAVAAAAPAEVAAMGVDQLLAEARKAVATRRYLTPPDNNAYALYLRVLEKQPDNRIAADALRETFPFAATSAEQAINARDFEEARRQIELLARADPTNFTLTILRSKFDAQRKTRDQQQQQQQLLEQKAQLVAAQKTASDRQAAERLAAQPAPEPPARQRPMPPAVKPPPTPTAGVTATAAAVPARVPVAGGPSSDALLTHAVLPTYPSSALRMRQSGWVVVSFTIGTDGRTSNVAVVDSHPRQIFDRAATDAVTRYHFTPAMRDGAAVSSRRQQRIEFNQ